MKAPKMTKVAVDCTVIRAKTSDATVKKDREYWWSRTPEERLAALEQMRQAKWGYDPNARGPRIGFEVVEFKPL